jgi:hypothetical protein
MGDIAGLCPNETETLRVGSYLVDQLIYQMLGFDGGRSWKNEFSVHTMGQLRDEWLPHARSVLGLSSSDPQEAKNDA